MSTFQWLFSFLLAATMVSALPAEPHCPGNAASVPLHLTNGHQMIVEVSVNHSGPYNFLLDTGAEMTIVDSALASELHLNTQGSARLAGVGFVASAPFAQLDLVEIGSHAVVNQNVLVFDFRTSQSVDSRVFRGVLGEDFFSRFDMLIDNVHTLLCLDDSSAIVADVKGPHIALLPPARATDGIPALRSLIIEAQLSNATRPVRLKLDSGTNVSFLFYTARYMPLELLARTSLHGGGSDRAQRPVSTMPLQDVQIGSLEFPRVSFFTYADSPDGLSRTSAYDGLLTLGIFRRVFICHTHHFAVFEPW
jgi:hypothetical protein